MPANPQKRTERRIKERREKKAFEEAWAAMQKAGVTEDRRKEERRKDPGLDQKLREALGDKLPDRRRKQR